MKTIYVVWGHSGSGKNYVCDTILDGNYTKSELKQLKYLTTRPKRENDESDNRGWYEFHPPMNENEWAREKLLGKRSYTIHNGDVYRYGGIMIDMADSKTGDYDYITPQIESIYGLALLINYYKSFGYRVVLIYVYTNIITIKERSSSRISSKEEMEELEDRLSRDFFKFFTIDTALTDNTSPAFTVHKRPKFSELVFSSEWNREKDTFFYDEKLDWDEWRDKRIDTYTVFNNDDSEPIENQLKYIFSIENDM